MSSHGVTFIFFKYFKLNEVFGTKRGIEVKLKSITVIAGCFGILFIYLAQTSHLLVRAAPMLICKFLQL